MTHVLHTVVTTLLSSTPDVHLDKVTVEQGTVRLQLTATAPHARCPSCAAPSSSVHSRYQRHLTDLPWGVRPVHIKLTVRKFVCRNTPCTCRIFTERLPDLVAPSARNTHRLITVLRATGLALLVDLATHLVVDLLSDRSAATLASRLEQHPTITTVCHDRSELYADGIRRGPPRRCRWSIASTWSRTSARPWKPC
jgi:transposase